MTEWYTDETEPDDRDEEGAEWQVGRAYSVRYLLRGDPVNANGLHAIVQVGFFCNDRWGQAGANCAIEDAGMTSPPPASQRYNIEQYVWFGLHSDPTQPVDTEVWGETLRRSSWFAQAEPFTDEQICALMKNFKPEWIYWDGGDLLNWREKETAAEPVELECWDQRILTAELVKLVDESITEREYCARTYEDPDAARAMRAKMRATGRQIHELGLTNDQLFRVAAMFATTYITSDADSAYAYYQGNPDVGEAVEALTWQFLGGPNGSFGQRAMSDALDLKKQPSKK